MPRAASASAFLRMAAITGAESTGKLRGAAKEMYAERCAAGWNGVSAHAAAGRATMPCRGALADLHQPRPSSRAPTRLATAPTRVRPLDDETNAHVTGCALFGYLACRAGRLLCCKT